MPRNAPIVAETAITIKDRRIVSWRVGHVTRRNSETTSPSILKLNALFAASVPRRLGMPEFRAIPYLTSLCSVCARHRGQNFLSSSRSGSFRRFFVELYVRSRQSTQPRVTRMRAPALRAIGLLPKGRICVVVYCNESACCLIQANILTPVFVGRKGVLLCEVCLAESTR